MTDILHSPRCGWISEGNSENPFWGGEITKVMVRGYRRADKTLPAEGKITEGDTGTACRRILISKIN